jgi:hypothetical protein
MRIDNQAFNVENQAQAREPRFVFSVDFGADDVYFLTSHPVTGLTGENVIEGVLVTASGTSQRLNPDKANSEIGSISFTVLDQGLTDLQREKLAEGKGLKGKRVEFYVGSEALDWSSYIRATTQIIDDVSYRDRAYKFKCADIQRQMRKKIFEIKETSLTTSLGVADSRIRVVTTSGFERVWQPESPTGITVAPGMKVGFVRIDGDNDEFEVVMYTGTTGSEFEVASRSSALAQATQANASSVTLTDASAFRETGYGQIDGQAFRWGGKSGNTLVNCSSVPAAEPGAEVLDAYGRGMFGTRPAAVEIRDGSDQDNAPKVEEFVYLEMPAPMLAYALLTGAIYGYPGEYLPDHWHLGIAAEYIRTSEYIGIGEDLWNLDNFDVGLPAQFLGLDGTDGKQFIEEQIFRMMGCYAPIYADGQIGLRRMSAVVSRGGFARELNATNVASYSDLTHDMGAVINQIVVIWNYSLERGGFTRVNVLIDPDSIAQHGESDQKELEFRGLSGSRVAYPTIKGVLDSFRDRYAGPPLRLTLTLTPDQNDLEVGDIVRVVLDQVKDYTGETVDGHLDRNFEVQRVQTDWRTGEVRVELFGSSQPASALPPEESGAPIPNSWYESEGTEISAANFPGAVSSSGGITTVESDITLTGGETLSDGIYWCGEDLTLAGGVTVTVTDNVQLRVRGFFQNNAVINGRGLGLVGGQGVQAQTAPVPVGASRVGPHLSYEWQEANLGQDGYLQADVVPQLGCFNSGSVFYHALYKHKGNSMRSGGRFVKFPALSLQIEDGALAGLPADLRGSGGPGGGPVVGLSGTNLVNAATGGDGGRGGAGLAVICRGAEIGGTGYIDLSGELGGRGTLYDPAPSSGLGAYSGSGAGGGPGGLLFALDGTTATRPTIEGSTFKAEIGALDVQGQALTNFTVQGDPVYTTDSPSSSYPLLTGMGGLPNGSPLLPGGYGQSGGGTPVENRWAASFYVQALAGEIAPTPDLPENTENPTSVTLQEATNTPRSANANLSTIEVGVQPPSVSNYAYGLVEYREKGQAGWFEVGPASPEATFVVPSDGKTYEVQVRGVSLRGKVNQDGTVAEIATTYVRSPGDVSEEPEDDPNKVVPAPPVNGLELFEQGNDTVFGGRDAKFVWRKTSVTEWFEMGQEGEQGAGSGGLDLYFRDYQVEVWADVDGTLSLVRTEWVNDPQFVYTYEKSAEDHARETGSAGAWRAFEVRVYCRGRQNQISAQAARLSVENVAPPLPGTLTISAGFRSAQIDFEPPEDLDYRDSRVWMSQSTGFTPGPENLVAQQYGGPVVLSGLTDNSTYYLRFATYDAFGQGTISSQFTVTTPSLAAGEVEGLSPWATVTDADRAFIDANLADDAIDSTKIVKLTASKIVTGTLAATEKISVEGQVESVVGDAVATLGPKTIGNRTGLISYEYSGVPLFSVFSDGSVEMIGSLTIPGAGGATANLSGDPVAGLNVTPTHLGYYDGASWTAYIDDNGDFYFGDGGEKYIQKVSGDLVIGEETDFRGFANFNSLDYSRYIVSHLEQEYNQLTEAGTSIVFLTPADGDVFAKPGSIKMTVESGVNDKIARLSPDVDGLSFQEWSTFQARLSFEVMARFLGSDDGDADWFIGKGGVHGGILDAFGFRYFQDSGASGAKLYAWSSQYTGSPSYTAVELATDPSFQIRLGCRQYSDRIEYYVDRSLVATITTNLPVPTNTTSVRFPAASLYCPGTSSQLQTLYIGEARYLQKDPAVFNSD